MRDERPDDNEPNPQKIVNPTARLTMIGAHRFHRVETLDFQFMASTFLPTQTHVAMP